MRDRGTAAPARPVRLRDHHSPVVQANWRSGAPGCCVQQAHLLPHIPRGEFPGQALSIEVYLEGGIRGVELGSVAFAYTDPETGEKHYPLMELLRMAIPRRMYTQAHLDFVIETFTRIAEHKDSIKGCRITYAPELLRHFTARFERL